MSESGSVRRAVAEIRSAEDRAAIVPSGNRSIHHYWHLLSPYFRDVLLPPQRRSEEEMVAWTWREPAKPKPIAPAELASLRKRLTNALRSFADSTVQGTAGAKGSVEEVGTVMNAVVSRLIGSADAKLAGYVCRTETGPMLHSWGAASPACPYYPDTEEREVSGVVVVGGRPAGGHEVVLENARGVAVARVRSDGAGAFRFSPIAAGQYRVRAISGRVNFPIKGIQVTVSRESVTGLELRSSADAVPTPEAAVEQESEYAPVAAAEIAEIRRPRRGRRAAWLLVGLAIVLGAGGWAWRRAVRVPPSPMAPASADMAGPGDAGGRRGPEAAGAVRIEGVDTGMRPAGPVVAPSSRPAGAAALDLFGGSAGSQDNVPPPSNPAAKTTTGVGAPPPHPQAPSVAATADAPVGTDAPQIPQQPEAPAEEAAQAAAPPRASAATTPAPEGAATVAKERDPAKDAVGAPAEGEREEDASTDAAGGERRDRSPSVKPALGAATEPRTGAAVAASSSGPPPSGAEPRESEVENACTPQSLAVAREGTAGSAGTGSSTGPARNATSSSSGGEAANESGGGAATDAADARALSATGALPKDGETPRSPRLLAVDDPAEEAVRASRVVLAAEHGMPEGRRQARVQAGAWELRLVDDFVLPTRPMPVGGDDAVAVLREQALRERRQSIPERMKVPAAWNGIVVESAEEDAGGARQWEAAEGTTLTGATVRGRRAALAWNEGGWPREADYRLRSGDGRILARIRHRSQVGLTVETAEGVTSWFRVEVGSPSPAIGPEEGSAEASRFEWRLLSSEPWPAGARQGAERDRDWLELPLRTESGAAVALTVALVERATGWGLVRRVELSSGSGE